MLQPCQAYQNYTENVNRDTVSDFRDPRNLVSIQHLVGLEVDLPNAISWLYTGLNLISHLYPKLLKMSTMFCKP